MGLGVFGLFFTGLIFHVEDIFKRAGMDSSAAESIFVPAAVISVTVRLISGWISDHVKVKYLLTVMLLGVLVSAMGLTMLSPGPAVWLIIIGNGVSVALFVLLNTITWPRFFGREHLGAIRGMTWAMAVLFSAMGPWLFSQAIEHTESYRLVGWVGMGVIAALLAVSLRADNPQRISVDSAEEPSDS